MDADTEGECPSTPSFPTLMPRACGRGCFFGEGFGFVRRRCRVLRCGGTGRRVRFFFGLGFWRFGDTGFGLADSRLFSGRLLGHRLGFRLWLWSWWFLRYRWRAFRNGRPPAYDRAPGSRRGGCFNRPFGPGRRRGLREMSALKQFIPVVGELGGRMIWGRGLLRGCPARADACLLTTGRRETGGTRGLSVRCGQLAEIIRRIVGRHGLRKGDEYFSLSRNDGSPPGLQAFHIPCSSSNG